MSAPRLPVLLLALVLARPALAEIPNAALDAFRRGDLAGAEAACVDWLKAHPRDVETAQLLGMTRFRVALQLEAGAAAPERTQQAFAGAYETLQQAERLAGVVVSPPDVQQALGYAAAALGRREEAKARLDRVIAAAPGQVMPYRLRGIVLLDLGEFAAAEADLRRATQLDPRDVRTRLLRARALTLLGKPADAHALLLETERVAQPDPDQRFELLRLRQRLSEDLTQFARARDELELALSLRPGEGQARVDLGVLEYRLGDFEAASAAFGRALAAGALPASARATALHYQGLLARHAGDHAQARRLFEAVLGVQPKRAATLQALAATLQRLDEGRRAREVAARFAEVVAADNRARQLEDKLTLVPGDAGARAELVSRLITLGRFDEARDHLRELRQRQPDHPALSQLARRLAAVE